MRKRVVAFHVEFDLPEGASVEDCISYIGSSLACERGMRRPADPMSGYRPQSLQIRSGMPTLAARSDGGT